MPSQKGPGFDNFDKSYAICFHQGAGTGLAWHWEGTGRQDYGNGGGRQNQESRDVFVK